MHHVNETVDIGYQIYWDLGFIVWGGAMFLIGWYLFRQGKRENTLTVRYARGVTGNARGVMFLVMACARPVW